MAEVFRWQTVGQARDYNATGTTLVTTVPSARIQYIHSIHAAANLDGFTAGEVAIIANVTGAERVIARTTKSVPINLAPANLILVAGDTLSIKVDVVTGTAATFSCVLSVTERQGQP